MHFFLLFFPIVFQFSMKLMSKETREEDEEEEEEEEAARVGDGVTSQSHGVHCNLLIF